MQKRSHQESSGRRMASPAACVRGVEAGKGINATKMALLITYLMICVKGKNHYCEPFPNTTIELLKKYHRIEIGRRWFFQCMLDLESYGYMRRQRRWLKDPDGNIESLSSLWWFTLRGAKYLVRKSIRGAGELLKAMTCWIHRDDARRPVLKDIAGNEPITDKTAALQRIREMMKKIGH